MATTLSPSLALALGVLLVSGACSGTDTTSGQGAAASPGSAGALNTGSAGILSGAGAAGVGSSAAAGQSGNGGHAGAGEPSMGGSANAGGATPSGAAGQGNAGQGTAGQGTAGQSASGAWPFPQHRYGTFCTHPTNGDDAAVRSAFQVWKDVTVTADGAGGFLRVRKPDSGAVVGSTASEGIGYGMILAAYLGDQTLFDGLWRYEQIHLDANGLMNWDIEPSGNTASAGNGGATDGDIDMAWALIMADRQWGGRGTLDKAYLVYAQDLINRIWTYEVDHKRGEMLMAGDQWGDVDVTNPSYFAPAYFRAFGRVTNQVANWNKVIDANYAILTRSLANANPKNGLVPAWCNSAGTPVVAFAGAPTHFQNDATRVPFRIGQDYCYAGEPRAKTYLALISAFYNGVGVANIVDGYELNGTPRPDHAASGPQAASFVGPAAVAALSDPKYQAFVDQAYAAVASQKLTAGTIYYQKSWTALSLLMLTGNLVDLSAP